MVAQSKPQVKRQRFETVEEQAARLGITCLEALFVKPERIDQRGIRVFAGPGNPLREPQQPGEVAF